MRDFSLKMNTTLRDPKLWVCEVRSDLEVEMKIIECTNCGSSELTEVDGYVICDYCQSRFVQSYEDIPAKKTVIGVQSDVAMLLQKCETDPANRFRYASLVLDIDPTNQQAMRYLS
jgi:DNA-directed RNA polymerase subunit RPC12/RpoP